MELNKIRVLVACEESQTVCKAFRELGHEAFSCDLIESSGGHPEWHLQMDVFEAIKLKKWDMMIAFPPCTFLTVTGNKWMKPEFSHRFPTRIQDRKDASDFFINLFNCEIEKVAIENPIGIMSSIFRKPDQIIQPYFFGDNTPKSTCLWLKNLPKLTHCKNENLFTKKTHVKPEFVIDKWGGKYSKIHYSSAGKEKSERTKLRSKTFPGIAKAMAEQWSTC